ncbi:MAG: hypothetical protein GX591_16630 [Planctomycetes bacterium]|nr:hypothetical protein [Planctomycetota bacterium]
MTPTTDGIAIERLTHHAGRVLLRVASAHGDRVVQCYVSGALAAVQEAPGPTWLCELAALADTDVVALVAVDPAAADTNVWAEAVAAALPPARVRVRLPRTIAPYGPGDRWRVTLAGIEHTGAIYPGGRHACGFGSHLGSGFGWDGREAAGWGCSWGLGEWSFDCEVLQWCSDGLPPGTYTVAVSILNAAGDESPAFQTAVAVTSYARPARDLTVAGYDRPSDTLTLTFTPSPDEGA